jgi:hypothetical protein
MAITSLGTLKRMQDTASRLWGPGRRWTPGEIAWAFLTGPAGQEVRFADDGWAWRHGDYMVVLASNPASIVEGLPRWVPEVAVQACDGDAALRAVLQREGYREVANAPFDLDMRLATATAAVPALPDGYVVRPADEADDLLGVHRAAWRPADLPFALGCTSPVDPEATSSLTASALAAVQNAWPYRRDLHVVAEAPDGRLAGSCIAWLDPATGVAAIEPLGGSSGAPSPRCGRGAVPSRSPPCRRRRRPRACDPSSRRWGLPSGPGCLPAMRLCRGGPYPDLCQVLVLTQDRASCCRCLIFPVLLR